MYFHMFTTFHVAGTLKYHDAGILSRHYTVVTRYSGELKQEFLEQPCVCEIWSNYGKIHSKFFYAVLTVTDVAY